MNADNATAKHLPQSTKVEVIRRIQYKYSEWHALWHGWNAIETRGLFTTIQTFAV